MTTRKIGIFVLLVLVQMTICRSSLSANHDTENMQYSFGDDVKLKSREFHLRFYQKPPRDLTMMSSENEVLECQAGGSPPPLMHWLKDGKAIDANEMEDQGISEDYDSEDIEEDSFLGISSTTIRLYLDCVTPEDSGVYTCAAETPFSKINTHTQLTVDSLSLHESAKACQKHNMNHSPKITMWTRKRLEYMGGNVRLNCRAEGTPEPTMEWRDTKGNTIKDSRKYKVFANGDLVIRKLKWSDMGNYACIAKNHAGSDRVETFLYPTRHGK